MSSGSIEANYKIGSIACLWYFMEGALMRSFCSCYNVGHAGQFIISNTKSSPYRTVTTNALDNPDIWTESIKQWQATAFGDINWNHWSSLVVWCLSASQGLNNLLFVMSSAHEAITKLEKWMVIAFLSHNWDLPMCSEDSVLDTRTYELR